jgi:hypothetical protein
LTNQDAQERGIDIALENTAEDPNLEFDESPEPLDLTLGERKLVTQPYDFSVGQLLTDVQQSKILLIDVPYQREYVWDEAKASRLIESLLLNVPIPVCYFAENHDGTWEVIDGLQRTHSIVRFLNNDLTLRGLSVLTELNGARFTELPGRDQRRIETRTLRFVVVTDESHPDIKFDVFERLNTGAVKLLAQELRNCIYRGTFNDELKRLAEDPGFRATLGQSRDPRMRDEELVLRFLALSANLPGYKPPIAQFLNEYMRANRRSTPDPLLVSLFSATMQTIAEIFDAGAFRGIREGTSSPNLNRALFDAVALGIAFADRAEAVRRADDVRALHRELLQDSDFLPLIGRATANRTRMHGRVRVFAEGLRGIGVPVRLPDLPPE